MVINEIKNSVDYNGGQTTKCPHYYNNYEGVQAHYILHCIKKLAMSLYYFTIQ